MRKTIESLALKSPVYLTTYPERAVIEIRYLAKIVFTSRKHILIVLPYNHIGTAIR